MPQALLKRCGYRGCPNTTCKRYCDQHAPLAAKLFDNRRGTTTERGYDGAWKRVAERRRDLDAGLCQRCLETGLVSVSQLVDHILPIHIRPDWRLEIGNTQVLCFDCHQIKTSQDMKRYGGRLNQRLSAEQVANRREALRIERPPRDTEAASP